MSCIDETFEWLAEVRGGFKARHSENQASGAEWGRAEGGHRQFFSKRPNSNTFTLLPPRPERRKNGKRG